MASVAVVGDVMLDQIFSGPVERLSPEAPWAPVVKATGPTLRIGGAGFVANVLRRLGHETQLIAAVGADAAGSTLVELIRNAGIKFIPLHSDVTTVKTSVVAEGLGMKHPVCRADVDASHVARGEPVWSLLESPVDALIVVDYNKGMLDAVDVRLSQDVGKMLFVADPKPPNAVRGLFRGYDVVTPNRKEAMEIVAEDTGVVTDLARLTNALLGVGNTAVTLGQHGAVVFGDGCPSGAHIRPNTPQGSPVTVSGAGDIFTATLVSSLLAGNSLEKACTTAVDSATDYVFTGTLA